jgi:predicted ribosome quality control (RQC) complex YloA/Tae2 family protein
MSLDGLMVCALRYELEGKLAGGRVERVHQPEREDLTILFYTASGRHRLFVSIRPDLPRLYLTGRSWPNPASPPLFCQLLRRHLEGARVLAVEQAGIDRIIHFVLGTRDEVGRIGRRRLILEMTGRRSNVILTGADDQIIDALRRWEGDGDRRRAIRPGVAYTPPPPIARPDFRVIDASLLAAAAGEVPLSTGIGQFLLGQVAGLGPVTVREICLRAGFDPTTAIADSPPGLAALLEAELRLVSQAAAGNAHAPSRVEFSTGEAVWAACELRATLVAGMKTAAVAGDPPPVRQDFTSASDLLDFHYERVEATERRRRLTDKLARAIVTARVRAERRLAAQLESLATAAAADRWRATGEAILANLGALRRGQTSASLPYFDAGGNPVTVEADLDPSLGPSENAQAYFRRYARARSTERETRSRYESTTAELDYLASLERTIERLAAQGQANPEDLTELADLAEEMEREGLITASLVRTHLPAKARPPLRYELAGKLVALVGRNDRENEHITFEVAGPADLWFHTKDVAGSHVILRLPSGTEVTAQALGQAALLAGYYSAARLSSNVPVDYTERRHVRKPAGSKPGLATYDRHRTIFVTPSPDKLPPRLG